MGVWVCVSTSVLKRALPVDDDPLVKDSEKDDLGERANEDGEKDNEDEEFSVPPRDLKPLLLTLLLLTLLLVLL